MTTRPRYLPLTPAIQEDTLREIETAATHITHVGHVIRGVLGVKWARRAERTRRQIDDFAYFLRQGFEDEKLAVQMGKGLRSPNGTRKERNTQRPTLRDDYDPNAFDPNAVFMIKKRGRPKKKQARLGGMP